MPPFEQSPRHEEAVPSQRDESGVRRKPQDRSRDRAEYLQPTEIRRAKQPDVVHEIEKVKIRTPEQVEQAKHDRERAQLLVEHIRHEQYLPQFETAAQQSTWQAHTDIGALRELMREGAPREDVENARRRLIPLLTYLRDQLHPYGHKMPQGEKTRMAMEAIFQSMSGIGEALHEADQYLRRERRILEREGGDYSMLSQNPELRQSQELWGQYTEKAAQERRAKKRATSGWTRFTTGLKRFFGIT